MNQDIRDALARLVHAIEGEARADDLLLTRLAEQERIVSQERARAAAAERQLGEALLSQHPTITPLWDETRCRVCGWPVKETVDEGCTRESCSQRPLPSPRADAGYVPEAVQALPSTDTEEHALRSAALSSRYAALLAAVEGVVKSAGYYQQDVSWLMVSREAFERLRGAINE